MKNLKKRITELFLARASSQSDFEFKKHLLKEKLDEFIECLYKEACYNYNNPDYHSNPFTYKELAEQPVKILK